MASCGTRHALRGWRRSGQRWESASSRSRCLSHPARRRIGPGGRWPRRPGSASLTSSASGARTGYSRTASARSSSRQTPPSSPRSATSSGSMSTQPAHAVVLSIDEKSQIQALDRTQPGLPLKPGRAGTLTHDYKRHGTTTLFAALDVLDGTVVGRCMQRHRHQEFIRFLNAVEKTVPAAKAMHVILDNYAAHKHPKVIAWLARHPRVTFHFTPTGASWLNAVEGFFATLTKRRLRRGAFLGVVDLQSAINQYLAEHNVDPKPFMAGPSRYDHCCRS